jgi:hypothetical protein
MRKQGGDEALQNEEVAPYVGVEVVLWPRRIDELEQFLCVVGCCCQRLLCSYKNDGGAQVSARCQGAGGKGVHGDNRVRVIVPLE